MPKAKQFLKSDRKKGTKAAQLPQTADEYLAAGVEFEEAGEKWRGGDAAKSTRFFVRAIDCYDAALARFPTSFDLAYNKARVQYELTQHPRLAAQLPSSLLELLTTALQSSRAALALNQDNADVLFNTAQVLTSLTEAMLADPTPNSKDDVFRLVEEAIELFQRCLTLQEFNFAEAQAQQDEMADDADVDDQGGIEIADSQADSNEKLSDTSAAHSKQSTIEDDRWALAVEPVTHDTLLDTLLAQLEALTILCGLANGIEGRSLAWIEEYSTNLINIKLIEYIKGTNREAEAALTRANFIAAMAEANYSSGRLDISTYERVLSEAYGPLKLEDDAEGLSDRAEALLSFDGALKIDYNRSGNAELVAMRWKTLSSALQSLTAASKLSSADNTAKIHLARGDIEVLRYQLGFAPWSYKLAVTSAAVLLKNAGTFYRGAEAHATASKLEQEFQESLIKQAVVASIGGEDTKLKEFIKGQPKETEAVLEEMVEESLLTLEWLHEKGISTR